MKPLKKAIVLCWIMLVACFAIKLFGGNWFEVVCTDEHFSIVCKAIDENWFLYYPIGYLTYVFSMGWSILATTKSTELSMKELICVVVPLSLVWATQFISSPFRFIMDAVAFVFIPIGVYYARTNNFKIAIKNSWYRGFICAFLTLAFQAISLITRNVGIKMTDDSTLVTLILMLDYYIMIILYYLYMKNSKKEVKKNG